MRITDLDELIQPEIQQGKGFTHTHTDELGLIWTAHSNGNFDLTIDVQSPHQGQIAYVTLEVNPDEETMSSIDTYVAPKFRRMGIATKMYNWAEELGNTVVKSSTLLPMGRKFWKNREKNLAEARIHMPKFVDVFFKPDPRSQEARKVAEKIPTGTLDFLIKAMCKKFGTEPTDFVWKPVDEPFGHRLDELDFMGRTCTKDCSGHKAGYKWSLDRGGITTQTHSPSFDDGTDLAQSKAKMRKQGGGKLPGYVSQTPDAIRKREARLQARQAQATHNVQNPPVSLAEDTMLQSQVAHYDFNSLLVKNLRAKYPEGIFEIDGDRVVSSDYELIVIAEPQSDRIDNTIYVGIEVIDVYTGPYKGVFAQTLKQATEHLQRLIPHSKPALWVENDMSQGTWGHIAKKLGYRIFHV